MTIIVCIKFRDGIVLATDSRAVYDAPLMREGQYKMEVINNKFCVAGSGLGGAIDRVIEDVREKTVKAGDMSIRDFVTLCEDSVFGYFARYYARFKMAECEEDYELGLVVASKDRMFRIGQDGTSEEEKDYLCEGSSDLYGEYVLRKLFKPNSVADEAAEWAVYVVREAKNMDPDVGGPTGLAFITSEGARVTSEEEVRKIESKVSQQAYASQRDLVETVGQIVDLRRNISQSADRIFRTKLLRQQEFAIWGLVNPVITEENFTDRILALGVLIDEMDAPKVDAGKEADATLRSVNLLESWLIAVYPKSEEVIRSLSKTLRELKHLRSKKLPVHPDDVKFISVVVGWGLAFPPDWSQLYLAALGKYVDVLKALLNLLDKEMPSSKSSS